MTILLALGGVTIIAAGFILAETKIGMRVIDKMDLF